MGIAGSSPLSQTTQLFLKYTGPRSHWPLKRLNTPSKPVQYNQESNAPFRVTSEHSFAVPLVVLLNTKPALLLLPLVAQEVCLTRDF